MSDSKTTSERLTIVRELTDYQGDACLVKAEPTGEYFVVSTIEYAGTMLGVYASMGISATGETLVFRANTEGDVIDWGEVAGGKGMSREDAMEELESRLDGENP